MDKKRRGLTGKRHSIFVRPGDVDYERLEAEWAADKAAGRLDEPIAWNPDLIDTPGPRTAALQAALKARKLFRPKLRELAESCVSCPFRKDNDHLFGAVLLQTGLLTVDSISTSQIAAMRYNIRKDVATRGDFLCHSSIYSSATGEMARDPNDGRQCPGATAWYKSHLP